MVWNAKEVKEATQSGDVLVLDHASSLTLFPGSSRAVKDKEELDVEFQQLEDSVQDGFLDGVGGRFLCHDGGSAWRWRRERLGYGRTVADRLHLVRVKIAEPPAGLVNGNAQRAAGSLEVVGSKPGNGRYLAIAQNVPDSEGCFSLE